MFTLADYYFTVYVEHWSSENSLVFYRSVDGRRLSLRTADTVNSGVLSKTWSKRQLSFLLNNILNCVTCY
jgi:hypothetical protein